MQSVSSKICTRVTVSISYDENHYITGTSKMFGLYRQQNFGLAWSMFNGISTPHGLFNDETLFIV